MDLSYFEVFITWIRNLISWGIFGSGTFCHQYMGSASQWAQLCAENALSFSYHPHPKHTLTRKLESTLFSVTHSWFDSHVWVLIDGGCSYYLSFIRPMMKLCSFWTTIGEASLSQTGEFGKKDETDESFSWYVNSIQLVMNFNFHTGKLLVTHR